MQRSKIMGVLMEELGKQIDQLSNKLTALRLEIWIKYTLFTWQWWMLVLSCIGIIILFIVLIRKENLLRAFAYLGLVYIFNKNLDDLATALDWYDYRMQLEPIIPTMLPANLFIIPGLLTILYERYVKWKQYLIAIGAFGGFVSYLVLPLMKAVKIYMEKTWNGHLSFLSLILMAVASKFIVDAAVRLQSYKRNEPQEQPDNGINLIYVNKSLLFRKKSKST
jgi:hypothetical protein